VTSGKIGAGAGAVPVIAAVGAEKPNSVV